MSLIIVRSFPKISRRVGALQFLFTPGVLQKLEKENLKLARKLEVPLPKQVEVCQVGQDAYVKVSNWLQAIFTSHGVPCETRDGTSYYLFHTSSAILWIRALVSVYDSVKASTQKHPTNHMEWHTLYTHLKCLHYMVYFLGDYYNAILCLPGLDNFLENNLEKQYVANDSCKYLCRRMILGLI